jgi:DNA-binding transcriptional MerR regulator
MALPQTFTLAELEELTGFDRRTIAYYISEGLLTKVGRRGPGTRYPAEVHDRLRLIRRIKDLQDAGRAPPVALAEIAAAMDALDLERIRELGSGQAGEAAIVAVLEAAADPERGEAASDSPESGRGSPRALPGADAVAGFDLDALLQPRYPAKLSAPAAPEPASARQAPAVTKRSGSYANAWPPDRTATLHAAGAESPQPPDARLREVLQEIDRRAALARQEFAGTSTESLLRVPITANVMLAVRGLTSMQDRELAEQVAALLARYFD